MILQRSLDNKNKNNFLLLSDECVIKMNKNGNFSAEYFQLLGNLFYFSLFTVVSYVLLHLKKLFKFKRTDFNLLLRLASLHHTVKAQVKTRDTTSTFVSILKKNCFLIQVKLKL